MHPNFCSSGLKMVKKKLRWCIWWLAEQSSKLIDIHDAIQRRWAGCSQGSQMVILKVWFSPKDSLTYYLQELHQTAHKIEIHDAIQRRQADCDQGSQMVRGHSQTTFTQWNVNVTK